VIVPRRDRRTPTAGRLQQQRKTRKRRRGLNLLACCVSATAAALVVNQHPLRREMGAATSWLQKLTADYGRHTCSPPDY